MQHILSFSLKVILLSTAAGAIDLAFRILFEVTIVPLLVAVVCGVLAVFHGLRLIATYLRRRRTTRRLLAESSSAAELAKMLHQDVRLGINNPLALNKDYDYIAALFALAWSAAIIWLGYFSFHWLNVLVGTMAGIVLGQLSGWLISLVANAIHNSMLAGISRGKGFFEKALRYAWQVKSHTFAFHRKDAPLAEAVGLDDVTVPELASVLCLVDLDSREKIIKMLIRLDDPRGLETVAGFIRLYPINDGLAVKALSATGERALPALQSLLQEENSSIVIAALRVLGKIRLPEARLQIATMLDSGDELVRRNAVYDLYSNDPDWQSRADMAAVLAKLRSDLDSDDSFRRTFARWALGVS